MPGSAAEGLRSSIRSPLYTATLASRRPEAVNTSSGPLQTTRPGQPAGGSNLTRKGTTAALMTSSHLTVTRDQARGSSTSISSSRGEGDDSGSVCVPDAGVSAGEAASAAGPTAGRGAAAGVGEAVDAGAAVGAAAGLGVGAGSVETETRRQPCSCHPGRCTGQVHRCCLPLQMRTIRCSAWGRRGPLAGSAWGGAA